LRQAVDVLVVGASGELPANQRHAALLARRLLEYKVSAVVDLYELKLAERRRFVRLFLESLIHLPRDLWRPTVVILDEAHIYCPERGSGEAESTEAVISLMSQGRKRGYAASSPLSLCRNFIRTPRLGYPATWACAHGFAQGGRGNELEWSELESRATPVRRGTHRRWQGGHRRFWT
jgi:hypothetical protein